MQLAMQPPESPLYEEVIKDTPTPRDGLTPNAPPQALGAESEPTVHNAGVPQDAVEAAPGGEAAGRAEPTLEAISSETAGSTEAQQSEV